MMNASIKNSKQRETPVAAPFSPIKKWAVIVGIFCVVAGVTWFGLSWAARMHSEGRLLTEWNISAFLMLGAAIALIIVIPVIVRSVFAAKERVSRGEGLLPGSANFLESHTKNPLLTREDFQTSVLRNILGAMMKDNSKRVEAEGPAAETIEATPTPEPVDPNELATAHAEAAQRIQEFNSEMENLFPRWQQRIGAYEQRVEELERELASKESENSALIKRQLDLVNQHLDLARDHVSEESDTEFEVKPSVDTTDLHSSTAISDRVKGYVASRKPLENIAEKAAELSRQFKSDTESLTREEKIKAYEERIAAMEKELSSAEAENKELTWNQLQYMQKRLSELGVPNTVTNPPDAIESVDPTDAARNTSIRRRAALNVAELNERLATLYPNSNDRISAYEERLAKIEQMIATQTAEQREFLEAQKEMTRKHMLMLQGTPELDQPAPASDDVLSKMFGLQFNLNPVDQAAAREVARFNNELSRNNSTNDEQVEAYRARISELESIVERQGQENQGLYSAQIELVQHQLDNLESDSVCDAPLTEIDPPSAMDENGVPFVRIPEFQRAELKHEVPKSIRAMIDRKPTELKIKGAKRRSKNQVSG